MKISARDICGLGLLSFASPIIGLSAAFAFLDCHQGGDGTGTFGLLVVSLGCIGLGSICGLLLAVSSLVKREKWAPVSWLALLFNVAIVLFLTFYLVGLV